MSTKLATAVRRGAVQPRGAGGSSPALGALAVMVGAALAAWTPGPARADSGVTGVEPALGNALNPWGFSGARSRDPDGIGGEGHSRTPTGLLYVDPWAVPERGEGEGWRFGGSFEAGLLKQVGSKDNAKASEYRSLESGGYLNSLQAWGDSGRSGYYVDLLAGALGRDDQFAGFTTGRYNAWRLKLSYVETGHVFTTRYRNLWSGTGTGQLTLNGLPAGPAAPATAATVRNAIAAAVPGTPFSTLSVERRKGSLRYDLTLSESTRVFAGYSAEQRTGARPFGLVSGGGGGTGGIDIPESVDHKTHDFVAGLQWSAGTTSANLLGTVSLFRNGIDTMSVENPMFVAAANGLTSYPIARFDLYPDNTYTNLKAEVAHGIPSFHRARITGTVSFSSSKQDDTLVPMSPDAGAVVNGVAGGAWNTLASLSRSSADAKIDTRLADLGLALSPTSTLDLKAKLRHYETRNSTAFKVCNPLTGQIGRLINDGSGGAFAIPNATAGNNPAGTAATAYNAAACDYAAVHALGLVPSAGNVAISTVPYAHQQTNLSIGGDYRLARAQNLNLQVERETIDRDHRERAETQETRVKLGYVNRAISGGTVRVSVENARRRGSTYVADPYEEFLSVSLGPLPTANGTNVTSWIHVNDLHRKFDLADRDQWVVNLRWNHALSAQLDLSVGGQWKDQRFPESRYGRAVQRQSTLNADLNWQPSPSTGVYGYLVAQEGKMSQTGNQQNACVLGNTYYLYSDGSVNTTGALTAAQVAAGITVVGNSGVVTAANFLALCGGAAPTSPLYPTSRSFTMDQSDRTMSLGIGARHDFGRALVDATYTRTDSKTRISYGFNAAALGLVTSGAPTAAQQNVLALIGTGFPDLSYRVDAYHLSVRVPLNPRLAMRLIARYEVGRIRDWHYDGVATNPVPSANMQTYLDAGPEGWRNQLYGLLVQYAW